MVIVKPYYLFVAGQYHSSHFSVEEARAAAEGAADWAVYVYQDDGLAKVADSQPAAPAKKGTPSTHGARAG